MENFNLSLGLMILGSLAFSLLSWIRQLSYRLVLIAGLIVTVGACCGGGMALTLPANWTTETMACLTEDLADGHLSLPSWAMGPAPGGLAFVLHWELTCPRSKLMAVDRKW